MNPVFDAARRAWARGGAIFEAQCDLLYQCDLDCEHCYLDDKARRILPTAFWTDVFDQLADMDTFAVTLSGGELLLRRDILELIGHARSRGLFVNVKTHGGKVDEAMADALAALGVTMVQLSYYSTDAAIHDAVTRRPGSHAATLNAMKLLRARGLWVRASIMVMKRNQHDVPAIARELEELGVEASFDAEVHNAMSSDTFPHETALTREERVELQRFLRGGGDAVCSVDSAANGWGEEKLCVAAHMSLYIDPEGQVMPCSNWPIAIGDLSAGDRLEDLWRSSPGLAEMRALRKADRESCGSCGGREQCGFCPGQAWHETRDATQPASVVCETTWSRRAAEARDNGQPDPALPPGLMRPKFHILTGPLPGGAGPVSSGSPPPGALSSVGRG